MFAPEPNGGKSHQSPAKIHQNTTKDMWSSFIVLLIIYLWQHQFAGSMLLENIFHYLFTMPVLKGLSLSRSSQLKEVSF